MNWKFLFIRFGRLHWWIGTILIVLSSFALSMVFLWAIGKDPFSYFSDEATTKFDILSDIFAWLVLLRPSLAIDIKRIHDRGRTAYLLVPYYLLGLVLISVDPAIISITIINFTMLGEGQKGFAMLASGIFILAGLLYALWMFIELGFLRGTSGESKYGPDPLAPVEEKT